MNKWNERMNERKGRKPNRADEEKEAKRTSGPRTKSKWKQEMGNEHITPKTKRGSHF